MNKFIYYGRLPSLNDYVRENRTNKFGANNLKKHVQRCLCTSIKQAVFEGNCHKVNNYPIWLKLTWYEPNLRRDVDNIQFGAKFILDAMVEYGLIENDSQKFVRSLSHSVRVDKENPRVEVEIGEIHYG